MDIQLRPVESDEFLTFARSAAMGFGEQFDGEEDLRELEDERPLFEFDRSLAAFDGDAIVGTGGIFSFRLTVPGPTTVPAAGVTWIAVLPTHRRRGILTSMMSRQLADVRERGEPLAILYASESIIYGRFGYGLASSQMRLEIEPRYGAFARSPELTGRVRFIDKEAAASILPPVFDRVRQQRPGEIGRRQEWWDLTLKDSKQSRRGMSPLFIAVHESSEGDVDGFVTYRTKSNWENGFPANTLNIREVVAGTPRAYAGLWHFCLNVDLMQKVETRGPVDEPVRWMLADPRRLQVPGYGDGLWARLVDIPAALAGRRYLTEGGLVIEVTDPFCPENDGCYRLEGGPDGAQCAATTGSPDLALQVADLGALYLGGSWPSTLARAGRIEERATGALRRADSMFASARAPYCSTGF